MQTWCAQLLVLVWWPHFPRWGYLSPVINTPLRKSLFVNERTMSRFAHYTSNITFFYAKLPHPPYYFVFVFVFFCFFSLLNLFTLKPIFNSSGSPEGIFSKPGWKLNCRVPIPGWKARAQQQSLSVTFFSKWTPLTHFSITLNLPEHL